MLFFVFIASAAWNIRQCCGSQNEKERKKERKHEHFFLLCWKLSNFVFRTWTKHLEVNFFLIKKLWNIFFLRCDDLCCCCSIGGQQQQLVIDLNDATKCHITGNECAKLVLIVDLDIFMFFFSLKIVCWDNLNVFIFILFLYNCCYETNFFFFLKTKFDFFLVRRSHLLEDALSQVCLFFVVEIYIYFVNL